MNNKKIIVSGMRPTGRMHLGNYNSVLKSWIKLQNEYECFFFIADIHSLTTHYNNTENIKKNSISMIIDWISAGLNYKKCTIFIQSDIKETFELYSILSMITPLGLLERIPSFKDNKNINLKTIGFLGYPVLQGADILILNGDYVPIGIDQLPHLELIRKIAKKFNNIYNNKILKIPKPVLSIHNKIPGIDGNKMSKSNNNTILISDNIEIIKKKIIMTKTDPNRIYIYIKGNPENCTIWKLHEVYSNCNEQKYIKNSCKNAKIGCTECKKTLYSKIIKEQIPILKNIKKNEKKNTFIQDIINKGKKKVSTLAKENIKNIKQSIKL